MHGVPADGTEVVSVGEQHAGLAVAARSDQAHVDAVTSATPEQRQLVLAVDEQVRRDRTLEWERCALSASWFHDGGPDGTTKQN